MSETIQDRHICCPCCGTGFSSVDDPYEFRRIEAFNKSQVIATLRTAASIIQDISRGTHSDERARAIDEARDILLQEADQLETLRLSDKAVGQRVCERLQHMGVLCSWEHPGFVSVPLSDGKSDWNFGDTNDTWTGDLIHLEAGTLDQCLTDIPTNCQDVEKIATAIKGFLDNWNAQAETAKTQTHHG